MALNIENDEVQQLSRELADLTGESLTTAVLVAVRERLQRVRGDRMVADAVDERTKRIVALGQEVARRLPKGALQVDDLYDDAGLPA